MAPKAKTAIGECRYRERDREGESSEGDEHADEGGEVAPLQ
jgi:hypothetical protein